MELARYIISIILIFLSGGTFIFSLSEWVHENDTKKAIKTLIYAIVFLIMGIIGIISYHL